VTSRRGTPSRSFPAARKVTRAAVAGVGALALTATLVAGPAAQRAQADPPLSVAEAKAQVEKLEVEAASLDQAYVRIQEELRDGRKKLQTKQSDTSTQVRKVGQMRVQVGQVALAKFQNRNLDTAAQLFFTKDTEEFLSQISTVEKVSENQNTTLQDFQSEQAKLADLQRSSETDVAALRAKQAELQRLRVASDKKIADSKAVLARLTREERERIAAEERRARAAALAEARAAEAAARSDDRDDDDSSRSSRSDSDNDSKNDSKNDSSSSSSASSSNGSRGERVVSFARRQLGKPYRFAAEGPDYYDCSGLVQAAYKSVGVSLPRLADDQLEVGRKISRSELRPGDLIGYYSPTSHIAIYIGNGKIIDAPRPGKTVRIVSIDYMPYNFANRPA
jgi:peptidoglycan DL-endopeptidase CwlO